MMTRQVIRRLYKKYNTPVGFKIKQDIVDLATQLGPYHNIIVDDKYINFNDLPLNSPFGKIPIERICGIAEFDKVYALILPSCILFIDKFNSNINIHINLPKESLMERIKKGIKKMF